MLLYYFSSAVKSIQFHVDDDIIDKLNYYYTTSIIIGLHTLRDVTYMGMSENEMGPHNFYADDG